MPNPHIHFHDIPNWVWVCIVVLIFLYFFPEAQQRLLEYLTHFPVQKSVTRASPDIAGTWVASDGTIVQIWPVGEGSFESRPETHATIFSPRAPLRCRGSSSARHSGRNSTNGGGEGTISGDGYEMTGDFWDFAERRYKLTLWKR